MSSVPPLKKCSTFFRCATSDTASATPEDQGPIMKRAPSPSIASSARRVDVPACVAPSRVMYLIGWPSTFMPRSSSAMRMPRSLSGPTSAKAPVWSHRPSITISFGCARMMAGNPRLAAAAPIFRISLRFMCSSLEEASLPQTVRRRWKCSEWTRTLRRRHNRAVQHQRVAATAAMLADTSRAAMVLALMDGRSRSAKKLALDVDLTALESSRRPLFRCCTDWTERRPHVAGALGAALLRRYKDERWLVAVEDSRKLVVTPQGHSAFVRLFDLDPVFLQHGG